MHMRQNGNMRLDGKVALVTGGGSGIGRAVAERFAAGGATVVLADVDITGIEEAAREIRTAGGEAFVVHTDVSKIADVQAMVSVAADSQPGSRLKINRKMEIEVSAAVILSPTWG